MSAPSATFAGKIMSETMQQPKNAQGAIVSTGNGLIINEIRRYFNFPPI